MLWVCLRPLCPGGTDGGEAGKGESEVDDAAAAEATHCGKEGGRVEEESSGYSGFIRAMTIRFEVAGG